LRIIFVEAKVKFHQVDTGDRDESGAESFQLFAEKRKRNCAKWKRNFFLAEMETKQGFPAETDAETEFPFPANMEFLF
jgi:hypothetical protein